jgi:hypothetical protein
VTDDGRQSDESDEHCRNAAYPMQQSFEPDSNVSFEREEQYSKQLASSISTEDGMQMEESVEQL